jgi:hypothetical protein
MSLPTTTDQFNIDVPFLGGPLVQICVKSSIDGTDIDVPWLGGPMWAISPSGTNIASWDSCLYSNINSILGVSMANVLNIDGLI